jgi:predicted CXXCH cytochrome family protein
MRALFVGRATLAMLAVGLLLTAACGDDIQYVERPPFNPPPDSATGFLGYYTAAEGFTTCGNCHADEQASWHETAHAEAWEGLQGSGHAASYCEPCHTISENGNPTEGVVGYPHLVADSTALPDSSVLAIYHDVQCESCHGPGNDHVANPSATQPLASAYTGADLTTGCGECHEGTHHPFVEQWAASAHNAGSGFSRGTRSGCDECHNGKVALVEQFGVTADYLEKDDGEVMKITCVVCHDPHSSANEGQLRAPISEGTIRNLCIKCHNRQPTPSQTTHGFHAAQGPLLLGQVVGWLPDSLEWPEYGTTHFHGMVDVNERLCAGCHVEMFATADGSFNSVGHLFEAIPCVDAQGVPVAGGNCAVTARRFNACTECHGTVANSRDKYVEFNEELAGYLQAIWNDVNGNDTLDVNGTDTGLLVDIVQLGDWTVLNEDDEVFTVAEGVLFNAQLAFTHETPWFEEAFYPIGADDNGDPEYDEFGTHPASGGGMHNPTLLRALLVASIAAGSSHYNVAPPAGVNLAIPADFPFKKR